MTHPQFQRSGFLFLVLCLFSSLRAQDPARHFPSVMLGMGAIKFTGDVGKYNDANPLIDARPAFYLKGEYRFGKYLGIMGGGLYGKFAGNDNAIGHNLNFQSKAMQFDMSLVTYFDHLFKQNDEVSPFLSVGLGYLLFDPYGDLKNGSGLNYYYWKDGSIRDLPENTVNQNFSNIMSRDHSYETRLKDSLKNYSRSCLSLPIGTGFDWRIGSRWDVQLGFNYYLLFSDYVDNYKNGGNDSYWMAHAGLKYTFSPKVKSVSDNVNFAEVEQLDVDGDGIPDDKDNCLSTPKGIKVDNHGCPFDSDKDGVADYLDKEPESKRGAKVDGFGMTINEDSLAYHQIMWDSLAAVRSEGFTENPSLEYLKNVEEGSQKTASGDHAKIPDAFKPADLDKNGHISVKEVYKVMDMFFEGTNDFTAEKLQDLIDYFFEQ